LVAFEIRTMTTFTPRMLAASYTTTRDSPHRSTPAAQRPGSHRQDLRHLGRDRVVDPAPTQRSLATLEWIDQHENLVVCGPSGTGKSHLLEALGHAAINNGAHVHWFSLETLAGSSTATAPTTQ
jgi:chromosomal replication initiation ATPase DnaA